MNLMTMIADVHTWMIRGHDRMDIASWLSLEKAAAYRLVT